MPISTLTTKHCNRNGMHFLINVRPRHTVAIHKNSNTMKNHNQIPYNASSDAGEGKGSNTGAFRRLMALLTRAKINEDARHDLVYSWTKGRTASSRELTESEIKDLIWKFENHFDAPAVTLYVESEMKRRRSIVLTMATETGIKEPNDFASFNRFMLSRSVYKKDLRKYTLTELDELIIQFRGLERNFNTSATHPGTKAWYKANGMPVPTEN